MRGLCVIPTHSHATTLPHAVASALEQSVAVDVVILGDGVTDEVRAVAHELARTHARVTFVDRPKSPDFGQANRHQLLLELPRESADVILYLSDDDLWLPHHVETFLRIFSDTSAAAVFGPVAIVTPQKGPKLDARLFGPAPFMGVRMSAGAHRLDVYPKLRNGWSSSDRSFRSFWSAFDLEGHRVELARTITAVHFPDARRLDMTAEAREKEIAAWRSGRDRSQDLDHALRAALDRAAASLPGPLPSAIEGVRLIELERHSDDRGTVFELVRDTWTGVGRSCQWNAVVSAAGVLRGVHWHEKHWDYICPVSGKVAVALIDLRVASPTERAVQVVTTTAKRPIGICIPPGVGHGILSLTRSVLMYGVSTYYDPGDEFQVRYDDPDLGITWPAVPALTSERDLSAPRLAHATLPLYST